MRKESTVEALTGILDCGRPSRLLFRLTMFGLAAIAAYASLRISTLPFVWFWLAWCVICLLFGLTASTSRSTAVWVNIAALTLALGLGELYLWETKIVEISNTYCCDNLYAIQDDDLGAVPRKSYVATHTKTANSIPIYTVTYTIDANGLRVSPPYDVHNVRRSILFFGCSFTMGDGVEDHETMPYMTGVLTDGRYAVYNFGFHGYGPVQMLAALEKGRVQSVVTVPPKYIIYQALPQQIKRVAGLITWFPHAPLYRRVESGRVVPYGHIDTVADETRYSRIEQFWRKRGPTGEAISRMLRKSLIYDHFVPSLRSLAPEDVRLFLDIVLQARETAAKQYPNSEFHIILWDNLFVRENYLQFLPHVLEEFQSRGVRLHLMSNIIPDYDASAPNPKYEIHRYDHHPNPHTYHLIANYVSNNIIPAD